MEKSFVLGILPIIFMINFISAASVTELLENLDDQTVTLFIIFIISLALINFALSRVFTRKENAFGKVESNKTSAIISLALAFGITFAVHRSEWEIPFGLSDLLFSIGVNEELFPIIIAAILFVGFIYLVWKFKIRRILMVLGLLLIIASLFTDIFDEPGVILMIGIILFIIGLILWWIKKKPSNSSGEPGFWTKKRKFPGKPGFFKRKTGRDIPIKRAEKEAYKENAKRDAIDRKKYKNLIKENKRLFKRNKKIPKLETSDGRKRQKNIEKMKKIESKVKRL